jgi:hypothetical protein
VYALIVSDLTEAIELFSTLESHYQFRQFRANLPMAMLLLARTHLFMENWTQAAHYSQRLIDEWGHRFQVRDLRQLTVSNVHPNAATTDDPNVRRTQHFDPNFLTHNNPDVIWLFNSAADVTRLTSENLALLDRPTIINNNTFAHLTLASRDLINTFDPSDLRLRTYFVRSLFFEPDYNEQEFDPAALRFRAYGKMRISDDATGIPRLPPGGNSFLPSISVGDFGQSLRITEAFLILAEAQAMLGQSAQALQTLHHIWRNRFADGNAPVSYTEGDIVQVVRNERRRELALESHRWFDLRRWGQPQIERVWVEPATGLRRRFTLTENDPGYTLPLPHDILNRNIDLVQVPLYRNGQPRQGWIIGN